MAKLNAKARKALPNGDFALPGRRFPIENKAHARDAKARASEMYHEGKLTKAQLDTVNRKADHVLHRGGK